MKSEVIQFNTDVSEYLKLNGFEIDSHISVPGGMIWRKEKLALQFWRDRIELHLQDGLGNYSLKNIYKGFDGQNIQHLIMILHCMEAITIDSANKLAEEQEDNVKHIGKILMSMPVSGNLINRS